MACFFQTTGWQSFLKQKKIMSQQTRKRPYIYDIHTEEGCPRGGILKICHMSTNSFVFKQKIYCSFLQMKGVGGITKLVIFVFVIHKSMTSKWFKSTTNTIARGTSFFFNIKSQVTYTFWLRREQPHQSLEPLTPLLTPLITKPKHLLLSVGT